MDLTMCPFGSATNPFTATLALKMAERREIELDAPIRRYLPDFQVADIEASERRACSPLVDSEPDEHVGIAWFVEDIGGVRVVSHAGRIQGFTAKVLFALDRRFGIVVLTNGDRGIEVYDPIIAQALRSYLGIEKKMPTEVAAGRGDLEPFLGTWVGDLEDYRFYWEGEQLTAQRLFKSARAGVPKAFENPPPISMGSAGKDLCIMTDGPYRGVVGELLRDNAGNPQLTEAVPACIRAVELWVVGQVGAMRTGSARSAWPRRGPLSGRSRRSLPSDA